MFVEKEVACDLWGLSWGLLQNRGSPISWNSAILVIIRGSRYLQLLVRQHPPMTGQLTKIRHKSPPPSPILYGFAAGLALRIATSASAIIQIPQEIMLGVCGFSRFKIPRSIPPFHGDCWRTHMNTPGQRRTRSLDYLGVCPYKYGHLRTGKWWAVTGSNR